MRKRKEGPGIKLTASVVKTRLKKINPSIGIIGRYQNSYTPIKCKCLVCAHTWFPTWSNLQNFPRCPPCSKPKLSLTEVTKRLRRSNLRPIGKYISANSLLQVQCIKCDHKFESTLKNRSCPKCIIERRWKRMNQLIHSTKIQGIEITGVYKGYNSKLRCICIKCRSVWHRTWTYLREGHGCPVCARRKLIENAKLNGDDIQNKLSKNVKLVGYKPGKYVVCQCTKCAKQWKLAWRTIGRGGVCPACYPNKFGASEERVRQIIETTTGWKFTPATPSQVPWLNGLYLDGYNKRHKVAFEYQGKQHYEVVSIGGKRGSAIDLDRIKKRDRRKRIQCWRHGIKLITIPYWKTEAEIKSILERRL